MRFDLIKLFLVCSAVFAIIGTFAIAAQADLSDPTLSVYYSFDEEGETVVDGSINGNDGTIVGNARREEGVYDLAIALETNTWIDMHGPEFKNAPVDGITLAFWVNHTGPAGSQSVFDAIGTDHESGLYHVEIETTRVRWFHRDGTQAPIFSIRQEPAVEANRWVHFAGTYDSESGDVKTYFDGEVVNSATGAGKLSDNWGVKAGIGQHSNGRWLSGLLDEFYIFGRALPADEVLDVMNGTFTAVEPDDKLTTTWGSIKSRQ